MGVVRDTGFQLALVKEMLDASAQRREIEEKIRAAEEKSKLLLEKAARSEIETYIELKMRSVSPTKSTISVSQLLLNFEALPLSP